MYATVFKADPLDPARGQRYRERILLPGGSREELDSLKVRFSLFLGVYAACVGQGDTDIMAGLPGPPAELGGVHQGAVWREQGGELVSCEGRRVCDAGMLG